MFLRREFLKIIESIASSIDGETRYIDLLTTNKDQDLICDMEAFPSRVRIHFKVPCEYLTGVSVLQSKNAEVRKLIMDAIAKKGLGQ